MPHRLYCSAELPQPGSIFQDHFRYFANIFMTQDREAMERQAVGLRYKPALMLIDDADTPAKWYYKLKAAYVVSAQTGQPSTTS